MCIEELDGEVGDGVRCVEWFVVEGFGDGPVLAVEAEGIVAGEVVGGSGEVAPVALEAEVGGLLFEVPLADHHGVIAGGGEGLGDGGTAGEAFAAGLVAVEAGEQGNAGGVALGGVVELGEAQSVPGEFIEVGGVDFGSVAAEIREAEVVGHDEDDVGAGRGGKRGEEGGEGEEEGGGFHDGCGVGGAETMGPVLARCSRLFNVRRRVLVAGRGGEGKMGGVWRFDF